MPIRNHIFLQGRLAILRLSLAELSTSTDFEYANKKALGAIKSIISLENLDSIEEISRNIKRIIDNTYSSYKNIDKYTSVIQASSVYLKQLKYKILKPILASLIFKGLPSSFNSFASRKYEEISNNLSSIDIEGLIRDLISEEARINTSTDLQANKAFKGKNSKGSKKYSYYNKTNYIEANYYIKHPELIPNKSTNNKKKSKGKSAKELKEESTKALISSFSSSSTSSSSTADQAYATIYNYRIVLDSSASNDILPIIGRGDISIITREGGRYYNTYYLEVDVNHELLEPVSFKVDSNKSSKLDLYHKRLLHTNKEFIYKTIEGSKGLKIQKGLDLSDYSAYNSGKIYAISSIKPISDTLPLTIFDIDIAGPFKIKSLKGERYFLTITLRVLGSLTYVLINKRTNKFKDKSDRGILVGYKSANNFLVYIPEKRAIISSKNVLIKEDLTFKDKVISKEELESFDKILNDCETSDRSNRVISSPINTPKSDLSRAENSEKIDGETADNSLNKEKVIEDIELDLFNDIAEELIVEIPKRAFISSKSDEEIRLSLDPERILIKKDPELKAMNKEIASLENHNTWKVVDSNTKTIKLLKTRWVYKIKELESEYYEFKARFVAKGFE
ncbi:uncharacterized protein RCO7_11428 [Rhynchosporium graminicola]|uniref:Retroviral polymerase SH3-like domain-containing protein n=1 Tax=Rhynchosporium graminicola TaxID=2792576 RepID=A0A1E1LT88_9HELO|nr:uncharacterized protein RCO7_11428 [Rhynchosporium commune]